MSAPLRTYLLQQCSIRTSVWVLQRNDHGGGWLVVGVEVSPGSGEVPLFIPSAAEAVFPDEVASGKAVAPPQQSGTSPRAPNAVS
jgi:hypothetical protein